ncbi:hypothetical protein Pryu01_01264 [Paraliobacillus ryukyuensis]|uniref:Uncharacterized protein DUF955 n=1 Tax=Paraliobacillus ryukyuensis TaxID=200904 RepID=A0A366EB05_9BACI|nr:ImmA/IrrE family metallo-endopeptidase [Paraliobacillus ryukyuensis]RBO99502.1 uncharacterized protein DUF955 [Paraliobacillus ryukyuensis]
MYECLQLEAAKLHIDVQEHHMKGKIKGLYSDNVIWINKRIKTQTEKACVLAEELGHHHMTVGDILDQSKIFNVKQEKLARKWAHQKLTPPELFIKAYKNGCRSRYEIAEYLNVTEEFLKESIKYFREKYGREIKIDDFTYLMLDPLGVYELF